MGFGCLNVTSLVLLSLPYTLRGLPFPGFGEHRGLRLPGRENVYSCGLGGPGLDEIECGTVSHVTELGIVRQSFVYVTRLVRNETEGVEQ